MKTFSTSGTGNQQTLSEIETDKIPVYDSREDVTADLANLTVGQIVATKDTGDELAQPVNVVESGNLHAVSSDAVYKYLNEWELVATPNGESLSFDEDIDNFQEIKILFSFNSNIKTCTVNKNMLADSTFHSKRFSEYQGGGYSAGQTAQQLYSSVYLTINATGMGGSFTRNWNDSNFVGTVYRIYGRR